MRVTIAQLQDEVARLKTEKNSWYEKYRELKDLEDKRNDMRLTRLDEEQKQTDRQITNLMEIIRWQIRPNTAEAPFMPTKNERDELTRSRNY